MSLQSKTAAIILLGSELVRGEIQDSHCAFLGRELGRLGISISRVSILPDSLVSVKKEILRTSDEHPLIFIAGGLGPTSDDITREAVSDAAGVPLEFIETIWETMKSRFRGAHISESNRKQALIPKGFAAIANPRGTACGFEGKIGNSIVIVLPGPPFELQGMFHDSVPRILGIDIPPGDEESMGGSIFCVGESLIEDEFQKAGSKDVSLHTRLEKDRVIVRLEGGSGFSRELVFSHFTEAFGALVVSRVNISSAELLFASLRSTRATITFAESCTGGLLSKWITDIPGSSNVFWGSYIVYSNDAKSRLLGMDPEFIAKHGAVSDSVAREMAACALARSGADYSIAVTGIAGPDGGTPSKPVGIVWISIAGRNRDGIVVRYYFSGARDRVRRKAATCAFLLADAFIRGIDASSNSGY